MAQQKFLDLTGLTSYDKKIKSTIDTKDATTLQQAKIAVFIKIWRKFNMAQQKFLDLTGLTSYDKKIKSTIDTKDATTLQQAKSYAEGLGVNYDPAGTAQTKVNALEKGQVTTNKNDIATLKTEKADKSTTKADKSTTLAGYGIGDAYTKGQTDSAIKSAIANSGHLKRTIVTQLPEASAADEHTIYMIKKSSPDGTNAYDEYMVVNESGTKKLEKVGDSKVDLTNYATKTEVQTAKSQAISTASAYDEYMVVNESGTKKLEKVGDSKVDLTNYATKTEVQTAKSQAISTASDDATTKANKALEDAKTYANGLAKNYATAAQGAKADTALQKASITSGSTNGSISVGGTDVAVKGLGSAAYASTTAFDAAGVAESKVNALSTGQVSTNGSISVGGTDVAVKGLGSAAYASTTAFDAAGVAESKVNALSTGQVATNKNNIASLRTDVDNLKSTTYVAITTEEINALFA